MKYENIVFHHINEKIIINKSNIAIKQTNDQIIGWSFEH